MALDFGRTAHARSSSGGGGARRLDLRGGCNVHPPEPLLDTGIPAVCAAVTSTRYFSSLARTAMNLGTQADPKEHGDVVAISVGLTAVQWPLQSARARQGAAIGTAAARW